MNVSSSAAPTTISGVTSGTAVSAREAPAVRPRRRCTPTASATPSGVTTRSVPTESTSELTIVRRIASSWSSDEYGSPVHQRREKPVHTERDRPSLNEKATAISTGTRLHAT